MRYWYHPESDTLWSGRNHIDEKAEPGSELVEELSRTEYMNIWRKQNVREVAKDGSHRTEQALPAKRR